MTKSELRILYKQKRRDLDPKTLEKLQDLVLINFQQVPLPFLDCLHTYLPLHRQEVDTFPIVDYLQFCNPGLMVAVPKTDLSTSSMLHYVYDETTVLQENEFGIMEPVEGETIDPLCIDLVLVPLLAFDEKGFRVGYGKGFYDRFLPNCRKDVIKIGLSFFEAETEITDTGEFDISLNYCVTPRKVYEF